MDSPRVPRLNEKFRRNSDNTEVVVTRVINNLVAYRYTCPISENSPFPKSYTDICGVQSFVSRFHLIESPPTFIRV
ncbi:MAG TPA: hypothetical protein VJJ80_03265 [Patescibacteria group bacterium]|nr:hypothetical protein [Patescibacteria group bacterium]